MLKIPPRGLSTRFQTNTMIPPESIPAMAPARLIRFQKSENRITGPKVAPNPAHAKETMEKMTLFSSHAMIIPTRAIKSSMILEICMTFLSSALFFFQSPS